MKARSKVLAVFAVSAMTFAMSANAHDPKEFDRMMAPVAVPTNCLQLADTANYRADLGNAEVKALKVRCDKINERAAVKAAASAKAKAAADARAAAKVKSR